MLSHQDNELLTRVGPGTPMGELMRRYWVPVAFTHQLAEPDGPPIRVKLLGERLVAFRDTKGRVGLIDERCPHRTASMWFGRNEDCGLRCVYHGWKFDIDGTCTDLPSEPPGSTLQRKVRIKAYPCIERGEVIWTYMGPAELKPPFPDLEWTRLPAPHVHKSRHIQECNWLQAFEGGFDTSHLSFLHTGTADALVRGVPSRYEVIPTDFGFITGTGRDLPNGDVSWTANAMLMPFHKIIGSAPPGAHVWVPVDDESTMLYSIDFQPGRPFTAEELKRSADFNGIHTDNIPGTDRAKANRDNNYLIDRALQASGGSYSGMKGLGIQDCAIQESMGPIADRSIEHLGVSDTAIIKIRRLLLQTLKDHAAGRPLPGMAPASYRVRSARFTTPAGTRFQDVMDGHVRIDRLAAE